MHVMEELLVCIFQILEAVLPSDGKQLAELDSMKLTGRA